MKERKETRCGARAERWLVIGSFPLAHSRLAQPRTTDEKKASEAQNAIAWKE